MHPISERKVRCTQVEHEADCPSYGETSHRLLLVLRQNPILATSTGWRYCSLLPSTCRCSHDRYIRLYSLALLGSVVLTPICFFGVDKQKAVITFERPSAARTALLLQDAHLGTSQVHVSSTEPLDGRSTPPMHQPKAGPTDFSQEDKPRTTVVAGILLPPRPHSS